MKAIVLTKFGRPDVLQLQQVPTPAPRDDEILIRIYATTVTAGECQLRGLRVPIAFRLPLLIYGRFIRPKPIILGQELAGEIEAAGSAVTRFRKGDQVIAWTGLRLGAYAEYVCLPEGGWLARKPSSLSYQEAAALPVGGLDATYLLRRANLRSGERILINGAGGSIGTFAVQIAKSCGAVVTAVDSSGKLDMLRSIGAAQVIDYTRQDFTRSGGTYDVIFDVIGTSSFFRSVRMLAPDGRFLSANAGPLQQIQARWTLRSSSKKYIPWAGRTASKYSNDCDFLTALIEAGKIRSVIDRCYPLEQIAEAHRYVEGGQKKGSIVITVGHDDAGLPMPGG